MWKEMFPGKAKKAKKNDGEMPLLLSSHLAHNRAILDLAYIDSSMIIIR